MSQSIASVDKTTYFPENSAEIIDLARVLEAPSSMVAGQTAAIVGPDGTRVKLPHQMAEVLVLVTRALMEGMAVTVAPQSARLTTQEAADFLGVSRPTLVRMLERGDIPMIKPGRHRYVELRDLVQYQQVQRAARRSILDAMQEDARQLGLYDATDGLPPASR